MGNTRARVWGRSVVALLTVGLIVGASGVASGVAAAPEDAALLRGAYTNTTGAKGFRFASTRTITIGQATAPDYIFETDGDQVLPDRLRSSTAIINGDVRVSSAETAQIGRDTYVFLSGPFAPSGTEQWVKLDAFGGLLTGALNPIATQQATPLEALTLLNNVVAPQTVGEETIGGVPTTHLRGTVPLMQVTAGSGPLSGLGIVMPGSQPNATVDIYVGKGDMLVRRLVVASNVTVDLNTLNLGSLTGTPAGSGVTDARTAVTIDFADYNAAGLTVEPPTQAVSASGILSGFNINITLPAPGLQPTATPRPTVRGR